MPTMKERKRYILFKVTSSSEVSKAEISEQVMKACLQFLGELGVANAGVQFLPETWKNNKGIIRVGHKYVDHIKASLALVKKIGNKKVTITCLKVSGNIGKLKGK